VASVTVSPFEIRIDTSPAAAREAKSKKATATLKRNVDFISVAGNQHRESSAQKRAIREVTGAPCGLQFATSHTGLSVTAALR
jgi:hypothetical protein